MTVFIPCEAKNWQDRCEERLRDTKEIGRKRKKAVKEEKGRKRKMIGLLFWKIGWF